MSEYLTKEYRRKGVCTYIEDICVADPEHSINVKIFMYRIIPSKFTQI